jgi:hypothetical protein
MGLKPVIVLNVVMMEHLFSSLGTKKMLEGGLINLSNLSYI